MSLMPEELTGRVGVLEYHAEQTNERFQKLGDKLDRIIERMEQLTLNTSTLITTQGNEILNLKAQMQETTLALKETQHNFAVTTEKVAKDITTSIAEMKKEFATELGRVSARVDSLERWRNMLVGGGVVAGAAFMKLVEVGMALLDKTP